MQHHGAFGVHVPIMRARGLNGALAESDRVRSNFPGALSLRSDMIIASRFVYMKAWRWKLPPIEGAIGEHNAVLTSGGERNAEKYYREMKIISRATDWNYRVFNFFFRMLSWKIDIKLAIRNIRRTFKIVPYL